jgi:hypothetical protein
MRTVLNKLRGVKPVTRLDAKLSRQVKSINMTAWNSTTLGSIELALSIMFLLALSRSTLIASDNLNDHKP